MVQQRTRPQTVSYALSDSPVGQAAWIYEKFQRWADCNGDPERLFGRDALLDNITLYWLTNSAVSSARLYWESAGADLGSIRVDVPAGCSVFPREITLLSRRWAERTYRNLIYWNELDRGGHFPAFEQPQLFVQELRACFRAAR